MTLAWYWLGFGIMDERDTEALIGSKTESDRAPLSDGGGHIAAKFTLYKRRWFILFVLCLLNCSNAVLWLTFAPVADQTAEYLKVSLDLVNWLSLVYMVVAIFFSFITTWMLDSLGLRFSCTKLAALWFPDDQRATANTIASMANPLGMLFANIFSPMIIHYSSNLLMLLIIYAIPATIACFLATVGIRERVPPTPPSASVVTSSTEPFLQGVKLLLKNKAYMILLVCFGSGIGVFTCFYTLLEQILCINGYSNDFAGVCGACSIVFGVAGAGVLGLYVDKTKHFTEVTKISMCLTSLGCIAFAVVSQLRDMKVAVGTACAWFGLFGCSVYPIAMELGVECSYPVGEATSSGLIFISGQIQSVIYMVLLQALTKPLTDSTVSVCVTGGEADLNWTVPALVMAGLCTVGTCCFVLFFHTDYRRLRAEAAASSKNVTDRTREGDT